ncbi:MAG: DUF2188 domain-containing protein [Spirochaetes bacterium]|jgi:hypothetical protein|nr:DUF2188 domain-containing protein [Spirochaetota bacterium]
MARKSHHVVPASNGGWNIKKGGADRASAHAETKTQAIVIARKISQNQGSELVIHNKNGKISQSDSHGNDPYPPKGITQWIL